MTLVTKASDASLDAASAMYAPQRSGLVAGEALDALAPCYIKQSDGYVYMSNATSANEAAGFDGVTPRAYASGDSNVTLFGIGTKMRYATGMTPGAKLYIGATAGRFDTAATTGDEVGVARVVSATVIRITQDVALDNLGAGALTSTLATGCIPLPLAQARLIATADIAAKNAADGGVVSLDTDPTFKRVNGATDKQLRIAWAAGSAVPITWAFNYPPDLDDTKAVTVNLLCGMAGATDTPTIAVSYWEGVGDTNAGGNTAALAAAVAQKTVAIAAGDVGAYPKAASIDIIPGTHATDALYLYGAWITYFRM